MPFNKIFIYSNQCLKGPFCLQKIIRLRLKKTASFLDFLTNYQILTPARTSKLLILLTWIFATLFSIKQVQQRTKEGGLPWPGSIGREILAQR